MENNPDHIAYITKLLETKSSAKQKTYRHLLDAFSVLRSESGRITAELASRAQSTDPEVTIEFKEIGPHEFHVKLAGDLLIFVLHTNIVTFDDQHFAMQDPYIRENECNRYFGQIMIYNFMADSLKFNRVNDPGYLLARLMINHENRFFVEGEGPLAYLFNRISEGPLTPVFLNGLVKMALAIAIENDLMAPPYPQVKFITLYQKMEHTPDLGGGQKIGFRMKHQDKSG
ncbi:MAG: hypothetical protein N2044_03405 [Cyclobacteriaceae bacterium]|nr:hypothetical protein [Cyclobacteriaceae bacterium]MCX7636873.1 hypothetical protein [Cyclobacteriaceae bacterium]MDW8330241.1 hypothetical protein [Cyclobacteriaceae bacterium]